MENKEWVQHGSRSVIEWIMSRPEGKQFLTACLFVISLLILVIARQEYRYEANVDKKQKRELEFQAQLKACQQETIDLLKDSNRDAQKMRDSLYTMAMKQKEIEAKISRK